MNRRFESVLLGLFGLLFVAGVLWQAGVLDTNAADGDLGAGRVAATDVSDSTTSSGSAQNSASSDGGIGIVYDWVIDVDDLPNEAIDTLQLIDRGGPFPFSKDDSVFQNRERLLPDHDIGHYREYTVITPGSDDRGARRIVAGADGALFWTDDHYDSFAQIIGW